MKKKALAVALSLLLAMSTVGGLAGCNSTEDSEYYLEISVTDFGYGTEWVYTAAELFQQEDWVQEKYPGLEVEIKPNYLRSEPSDKISGVEVNTVDLFIGASDWSQFNKTARVSGETIRLYEDLSPLMTMTVPGENVTVAEKLNASTYQQFKYYEENGAASDEEGAYSVYCYPTISSTTGILYNEALLSAAGQDVPLTTDELSDACDAIVDAQLTAPSGRTVVPFMFTSRINYWTCMAFLAWWAQYEGVAEYERFYQGIVGDEMSRDIFRQTGRLRALEVIENLIGYRDGNLSPNVSTDVNTLEFVQAQVRFAAGEGVFQINGDWFVTETTEDGGESDLDFSALRMMKYPVISSIVEKLEYRTENDDYMPDDMLAAVVEAVDNGATSYDGVSEADFAKIREARMIKGISQENVGMIPSYATAKEVAKDFLLFLATDKVSEAVANGLGNLTMSFTYDFQEKAPELYNTFSQLRKDVIGIADDYVAQPNSSNYPLVYLGGMKYLHGGATQSERLFTAQNERDRKTAQQIYQEEIDYWSATRWQDLMISCGYGA